MIRAPSTILDFRYKLEYEEKLLLNPSISQLYQYIRDFSGHSAPSGALNDVLFEPLLAHFNTLMEAYQAQEEEE